MEKQNIRIKLRAYDNKILDQSTEEIVNTVKRTGEIVDVSVLVPCSRPPLAKNSNLLEIFCKKTPSHQLPGER